MKAFGAQLSEARRVKGYTQGQLAELMHVSRQAVSHWENGRTTPDIKTMQQLSQLLDCRFQLLEEQSDEWAADMAQTVPEEPSLAEEPAIQEMDFSAAVPSQAEAEEPQPSPASRRSCRTGWFAAGGLCTLLLCLPFLLWLVPKPSAEIVVAPLEPVAYLVKNDQFGEDGVGWDATFVFENRSDVPFTPEYVVALFYENDSLAASAVLDYDDLRPWMGNDKLLKGNDPLKWPFGTNQLYLTHMECVIYGTDDNGHDLQFRGSVQYVKEFAE